MVLNLPTNLRSPFTMVHATAGITAPATGISQSVADQNQDRFGMNGGRSTTTGVMIDGVNASAGNSWNGLLISPAIDSVQEVQVIRNAYDSQFGRSGGGMVSIVTRGGSSEFHGTAFEFLRNSALDANSWANNRGGVQQAASSSAASSAGTLPVRSGNRSACSSLAAMKDCGRARHPHRP